MSITPSHLQSPTRIECRQRRHIPVIRIMYHRRLFLGDKSPRPRPRFNVQYPRSIHRRCRCHVYTPWFAMNMASPRHYFFRMHPYLEDRSTPTRVRKCFLFFCSVLAPKCTSVIGFAIVEFEKQRKNMAFGRIYPCFVHWPSSSSKLEPIHSVLPLQMANSFLSDSVFHSVSFLPFFCLSYTAAAFAEAFLSVCFFI